MRSFLLAVLIALSTLPSPVAAEPLDRPTIEARWEARIRALLDQGKLPKIDMEASLREDQAAEFVPGVFPVMDELGVALIAADGYQRPKDGSKGYRWSTYIDDLAATYPDRFIPTANGGTNPNWLKQKGGTPTDYVDQMEARVRAGDYAITGEFDVLHYMSSSECKEGRLDRDTDIPITGPNMRRIFALSAETGVPFVIHYEPEDRVIPPLEEMLAAHPTAKIIVAHFGQVRHPENEGGFTPDLARRLLSTYPNLTFDLSVGRPGRPYKCSGPSNNALLYGDTILWKGTGRSQTGTLRPEWRAILADFPDRFVFATDYGGGRPPLPEHLRERVRNFNLIVRDLPDDAKQAIAYKNAWKLLTGREWSN